MSSSIGIIIPNIWEKSSKPPSRFRKIFRKSSSWRTSELINCGILLSYASSRFESNQSNYKPSPKWTCFISGIKMYKTSPNGRWLIILGYWWLLGCPHHKTLVQLDNSTSVAHANGCSKAASGVSSHVSQTFWANYNSSPIWHKAILG